MERNQCCDLEKWLARTEAHKAECKRIWDQTKRAHPEWTSWWDYRGNLDYERYRDSGPPATNDTPEWLNLYILLKKIYPTDRDDQHGYSKSPSLEFRDAV